MSYLGPDEFDEPSERALIRRPRYLIIALIWLLAMGGSAAGLYAVYRWTTRVPVAGQVPLIRADDQPTRRKPADPGGMAIPDQDKLVYTPGKPEPKVEQLLPPPEQPVPPPMTESPPPTPPPAVTAQPVPAPAPAPPAAASAPPEPVPVVSVPPTTAPPAPPTPSPAPVTPSRAPVVAAAPARVPPAPPAPVSPPAAGAGYRLQIGAVRTPDAARQEWERLRRANGDVLGTLGFSTARVDLGERGIFYRIQAGPIANPAVAERDCAELKRRGVGCILVKP